MITGMPRIAIATGDFSGIVDTFRNKLGMPVIDLSARTVPALGARIAMCVPKGGSNIELMSPQDPAAPLCQSLQRFLDRRGQGLFALMLEAPDPNAEAEVLATRGLNVLPLMAGAGGRDIHPNSTRGTLIRVYPVNSFEGEPPAATPVGPLSGVRRVIVAVRDLDDAAAVYGERLGLAADHAVVDPDRGVAFVRVRPPAGGVIELVAVRDRARPFAAAVTAHLDANPEGMYALVLQANDPVAMLDELRAKGLDARAAADSPDAVEIGRGSMFGALVRIERDQAAAARR
jgi:catechol 2,3-dioxygenase-like lactoylglutathione lyase family enzyme